MKKTLLWSTIVASLMLAACQPQDKAAHTGASGVASAPVVGLETDAKKLAYVLGYQFASQIELDVLKKNGVDIDYNTFVEAMKNQAEGVESKLNPEQMQEVMGNVMKKMEAIAQARASAAAETGTKFLAENKTKEGIKTTASGLQYKTNKEGTGAQVAKGDTASVEYEGRLIDGKVFDRTTEGSAFAVPIVDGAVIDGWIEGLQLMKEGGEYTLYIPAELAYGDRSPAPQIPENSVLVFDIKVKKVEKGGAKELLKKGK